MNAGGPLRIIVSRTDRIGDVVLTLPLCAALRRCIAPARVICLVRSYTRPVVECSPFVDEVIDWDEAVNEGIDAQTQLLADARADVILHVAPERQIARAAKRARIPRRIGTSHRVFHWRTCTDLVSFSRKRSELHEAQLNLILARELLGAHEWPLSSLTPLTELRPRVPVPRTVSESLTGDRFNLVIHPRSRGSSIEWPLDHYRTLIGALDPARFRFFISGSGAEAVVLKDWIVSVGTDVVDLTGRLTLDELMAVLHAADGFVGGSTGPLHLAAGVGIRALGLYPMRRPMHAGRWAPLGPRAEWLQSNASCDDCGRGDCECMRDITPALVQARLEAWADRT